jgi:drug/metabolite transporter (DMT)-like permease
VVLALLAATVAAVGYGVSTVMQAVATRRAQGLTALRQPLVVGALVIDGAAWLLSLVALDRLPLFVVQALLASSVVVVVLLARTVLGAPTRGRDVGAIVAVVGALVVLAAGSGEQPAVTPPSGFTTGMLVASGVLVAATVAAYARGGALLLATLGGLGYSGAAIAARGAHASGGLLDTVLQPLAIAIVACGAVGVLAYLRALERGSAGSMAAVLSVTEVVVPGAVGVAVLGDTVRAGWAVPVVAALVLAIAACVVLATSPASVAAEAPESPPAPGRRPGGSQPTGAR